MNVMCTHYCMSELIVPSFRIGQVLIRRGVRMLCLRLGVSLSGPLLPAASRRGLHKLASVQSASALPKAKFQGLLYPFSVLDPYLDRWSSL